MNYRRGLAEVQHLPSSLLAELRSWKDAALILERYLEEQQE
jgi:hypothetical protein